jgi:hypothetical protein
VRSRTQMAMTEAVATAASSTAATPSGGDGYGATVAQTDGKERGKMLLLTVEAHEGPVIA